MKQNKLFSLAEAAKKVGVTEETLREWADSGLLSLAAVAENAGLFIDETEFETMEPIIKFHQMGYSTDAIVKITRKVGLPHPPKHKGKKGKVQRYLTVGELAEKTGLNARTIKYWEERGIIEPTTRSEGGFRLYGEPYVFFCQLIQDLQLFGYALEEIKDISELFTVYYEINTRQFDGTDALKLAQIENMIAKINVLHDRMNNLSKGIERWRKLLKEKQSAILSMKKKYEKSSSQRAQLAEVKSES